ncbi:hypothetical protein IQ230_22930 [Gloeocapsopsis crepidinum LEGE 06123]|uniref:Holin n=1 Tax=Gloeocapsopsis crepidinum LEGE 06123 TaxID=588587 RepID=A0ABR9UXY3_9CHRO|nr:hypothetical protein [Gloeocapsopsis crepidinum]MBE9193151.1 hypothetical protein [Gloeocapsopsis crepidinum LEGE 06123]
MTTTQESLSASKPTPKSIFASRTFWGALLTLLVAIAPKVGEMVDNKKVDGASISQLVVLFGTSTLTILGRIDAKRPIYTPDGLPGLNKSDFQS